MGSPLYKYKKQSKICRDGRIKNYTKVSSYRGSYRIANRKDADVGSHVMYYSVWAIPTYRVY